MLVLVTYDVATRDPAGARRLARVARALYDVGVRVQYSVFECEVDAAQLAVLRNRLERIMDPEADSIRFYLLGNGGRRRVIHVGAKQAVDVTGTLLI